MAAVKKHLKTSNDPAAFKLDVTIGTLRTQCVRWFVQAMDAVRKPELVRKAFERCRVGPWNLSFDSVTSKEAIGALLEIQENKPEFWAELQKPRWSDFTGGGDAEVTNNTPASPFKGEAADDGIEDSTAHPSEIIKQFMATDPLAVSNPGTHTNDIADVPIIEPMADDLDLNLDVLHIPQLDAPSSRPKRTRKANKIYSMDAYDAWETDSDEEEGVSAASSSDFEE